MTDFSGEPLLPTYEIDKTSGLGSDFTISVDSVKLSDNAQSIWDSQGRIGDNEEMLETTADGLTAACEGESNVEFGNAFLILKYRHDTMQKQIQQVCTTLTGNAAVNTKINLKADLNAGEQHD